MRGGRTNIHIRHILLAFRNIARGNLVRRNALLICLLYNFVIYIGKVGYIINLIALILQIAAAGIKHNHRPGVPDMDQIVNRRSADIHLHLSRINRNKFFLFLVHRIVEFHLIFRLLPVVTLTFRSSHMSSHVPFRPQFFLPVSGTCIVIIFLFLSTVPGTEPHSKVVLPPGSLLAAHRAAAAAGTAAGRYLPAFFHPRLREILQCGF